MLAKLSPWQKTLLEAAEIIKKNGHRKGAAGSMGTARCVVGAICEAGFHAGGRSQSVIDEACNRVQQLVVPTNIVDWNDAPERTADEVIKALQEAAL